MKQQVILFFGLLLLLLLPVGAQEPALVKLPDTSAARLLDAYLKAFNSGQLATLLEFHAKHDARPERSDFNDAEGQGKLRTIMKLMGELKLYRVVESTPTALRVLITTSKGAWLSVSCETTAEAPDKLIAFRLDRIPTPVEAK